MCECIMCVNKDTCIDVCIHVYIYICIHMYMCIYLSINVYTCICRHGYMYVYMYIYAIYKPDIYTYIFIDVEKKKSA